MIVTEDIGRARSQYWNDENKSAVAAIVKRGNREEMSDLVLCCLEDGRPHPVMELFEKGVEISELDVSELDLVFADTSTADIVRRKMSEEHCAWLPWNWTFARWRDVKIEQYR